MAKQDWFLRLDRGMGEMATGLVGLGAVCFQTQIPVEGLFTLSLFIHVIFEVRVT